MFLESEAETKAKIQRFASRLSSRDPESLARFIGSLAVDTGLDTGPLREHVQTFIVGDNLYEATNSLMKRIKALRLSEGRHPLCGAWRNVGQRLCYILESIETLILPVSPEIAFELLVLTVERDQDVMMQCGGSTRPYGDLLQAISGCACRCTASGKKVPGQVKSALITLEHSNIRA